MRQRTCSISAGQGYSSRFVFQPEFLSLNGTNPAAQK
jgi:hypothetical protein